MDLTAVISQGEGIFIGGILEIPDVFSQGNTMDEAKDNLMNALHLWLKEARKDLISESLNIVHIDSFEIN